MQQPDSRCSSAEIVDHYGQFRDIQFQQFQTQFPVRARASRSNSICKVRMLEKGRRQNPQLWSVRFSIVAMGERAGSGIVFRS